MSDQQAKIELEMRLNAIEFMLCKLQGSILAAGSMSLEQIDAGLDLTADHAGQQTFPGMNPVFSDLSADEFSTAVRRLTQAIKVLARKARA